MCVLAGRRRQSPRKNIGRLIYGTVSVRTQHPLQSSGFKVKVLSRSRHDRGSTLIDSYTFVAEATRRIVSNAVQDKRATVQCNLHRDVIIQELRQGPSFPAARAPASPSSRVLLHVFGGGASRLVRCSEVALVERANLVGRERANDRVEQATVVEEHQVVLAPGHHSPGQRAAEIAKVKHHNNLPIMRVYQLRQ